MTHATSFARTADIGARHSRIAAIWRAGYAASPTLMVNAVVMAALAGLGLVLQAVDPRMLGLESVWLKPTKFHLSLAVHLATLGWALSLLSADERRLRRVRVAVTVTLAAAWMELAIITARGAQGVASHFNNSTVMTQVLYAVMGAGAVTLTAMTALLGLVLWRKRGDSLMRMAAGLGLIEGAVLATVTAGYMSSLSGHGIGVADGGLAHLPLFHWSTTGGDLRVAHFVGLHAMQVVPLAGLSERRAAVWLAAAAVLALTVFTFMQALAGVPLLQAG